MLEDVVGMSEKLPRGLVMRPAWLRRKPRWLMVDDIKVSDSEAGWKGLFASFEEQGFFDVPCVLKKMLDIFDPAAPGTLHFTRKAAVAETSKGQRPDFSHVRPHYSSEENSGSWRKNDGASKQFIERHANGRPKLKLKPRSQPQ
eukprot:TRINITY_DN57730_c0_g1_i1.p1 TRINITY_DN57730_c0_g1~~TRINITY_DN57730_c0_g1_i1.p1  ORF type:complete len:153 (-),score=40.71 TRINITY_DN57730_c0_g1_i1:41-472(-)